VGTRSLLSGRPKAAPVALLTRRRFHKTRSVWAMRHTVSPVVADAAVRLTSAALCMMTD